MLMTEADIDRCLEITDELRCDLRLHVRNTKAIDMIQRRMLAGFAEGFRRGYWARDEVDQLNRDQYGQ